MNFGFYVCLNYSLNRLPPHVTNMLTGYLEPVAIAVHFRCLKTGVAGGILFCIIIFLVACQAESLLSTLFLLLFNLPYRLENCQQAKELQRPTLLQMLHHLLTTQSGAKVKQQGQSNFKSSIQGQKECSACGKVPQQLLCVTRTKQCRVSINAIEPSF